jgi:DNA-binding NarL/FixJ family response regulator
MPIQVLMADENQLQQEGLKKLFECVEDIKAQFIMKSNQEILIRIKENSPDLVILELGTPICNGIQMIRQIRQTYPSVRVLVLTYLCNVEAIRLSLEAGASGYLLKQSTFFDLVNAIRAVYDGNSFFHPMVAKQILNGIVQTGSNRAMDCAEIEQPLTEREIEILHLIAEGYPNQEIAKKLFISTKTVQTHRRNIMDKLGFHDRVQLVKYAIRKGIISLQE